MMKISMKLMKDTKRTKINYFKHEVKKKEKEYSFYKRGYL